MRSIGSLIMPESALSKETQATASFAFSISG